MIKEERIKEKYSELMETFKDLSEDQLKVAGDLIRQCAFMSVMLEDLSDTITEEGATESYDHGGGQKGTKVGSATKAYNTAISKYAAIINNLLKMIPDDKRNFDAELREHKSLLESQYREKIDQAEKRAALEKVNRIADKMTLDAIARGEITQDQYSDYKRAWVERYL